MTIQFHSYLARLGGLVAMVLVMAGSAAAPAADTNSPATNAPTGKAPARLYSDGTNAVMTLGECLSAAMYSNRRRPASQFAVAMAEAQHRQALAGYWPQITARAAYQRLDEAPDFLFPASRMAVPEQNISVPAGTALVSVPAQLINPYAPPGSTIKLPVSTPAENIHVQAQQLALPAEDVKLMDPDLYQSSLNATWLLYDGGLRKGLREQSQGLVDMMKQEARRTDLEIADSVTRMYYGAVLAAQLHQVGNDTLARMEATLKLTETMYKEGSGKVRKTDWLDTKVMVETLRSMVAMLEKNDLMARAALANTMGLSWHESVTPADQEMPYTPFAGNLENLVGDAYQFNPDWAGIEAGIRAAEGAVRTARSDYYPKLALTGEVHKWWNSYDAGVATEANKEGWSVGAGLEIPLFSGFLTLNKVSEMRARVAKIKEEQILLKEGLGMEIKDAFLGLSAAEKSYQATLDAMTAATENRDLNTRAYQNELVETEKVVRAQLMEALMQAQHFKARYDHLALQSQLDLLVGTEVLKRLQSQRPGPSPREN
jgi:outer membrane protein TolC